MQKDPPVPLSWAGVTDPFYVGSVKLTFSGELIYWRGPAPFYFVAVPESESAQIHDVAQLVTYGWGVIPVASRIGTTSWTTSLFPKNGAYLLPVKNAVREAQSLVLGQYVKVNLTIDLSHEPKR
jgi:hypothetical protein